MVALGRGIGTALLEDLFGWAQRDSRVKKVELRVRATNQRALALYRKFGFLEEGAFGIGWLFRTEPSSMISRSRGFRSTERLYR